VDRPFRKPLVGLSSYDIAVFYVLIHYSSITKTIQIALIGTISIIFRSNRKKRRMPHLLPLLILQKVTK
jgi:hypothetical protein